MSSSHNSTPTSAGSTGQYSTKSKAKSPSTSEPIFTALMQDAQARGKDPYEVDASDSSWDERDPRFDAYGNESYEAVKRRREAATILDSPELLMMYAQSRGDSIPGTRYYFMKLMCGYGEEDVFDTYRVEEKDEVKARNSRLRKQGKN